MSLKKKFIFISKNNNYFNKLSIGYSKRRSGCNFSGKKTVRFRGFINKKNKRVIDYFRSFWNFKAVILNFEYDPKRNTLINLVVYFNGLFSYILSVESSFVGMTIWSGFNILPIKGNCIIIKNIPKYTKICCVENSIKSGFKIARSSGSFAKIVKKSNSYCFLKLNSKKIKKVSLYCATTLGSILNFNFYLKRYKKAGFSRIKGFKPSVRGVAMNPVDHPHGGGEGKKSKLKSPKSPWGLSLNFVKKKV